MDLQTSYMGLELRNPLVASAGPISQTLSGMRSLADAGVAAITMYSLFEEQIRAERAQQAMMTSGIDDTNPEGLSYFPSIPTRLPQDHDATSLAYLRLLEHAANALDIPVIASLNGATLGGWAEFARQMEDAGAAGIELNTYYIPGDGVLSPLEVENLHIDIVGAVRSSVSIPVAVKLSPYFSSFASFAERMQHSGANALVLFNRFFQPDIDLATLEPIPGVELSRAADARLPQTWIAILRHHITIALAATSGVETFEDVVKYILAGADVVCSTSALVRHGPAYAASLITGLEEWLTERGYTSVGQARGLLAISDQVNAHDFERQGYVAALQRAKLQFGSLAGL
ncbi:MAG: dihydroorotate dehydrogenase-like protein [Propionibacteriaceae bacterium]|jgi:dihydroorotate dehydrogenase (fumarate)|nr:dihydroorotate dehydrogenase-like protein [Propionibacteriaceae bacterium]